MNEIICRRWFAKFISGNFTFKVENQTARPVELPDKLIEAVIEEKSALSVEELATKLSSNHTMFIVFFNKFKEFLNSEHWCFTCCLKTISDAELTYN